MNNNYDGNNISNEYKTFESQEEKKRVKNVTTNEELNKLVGKKAWSKKIIAMILAGTLFSAGATVGANFDTIKEKIDDVTSPNDKVVMEFENNQILENLCERTEKSSEDIFDDYNDYRAKLFEITSLDEAPTQDNFIRFVKNYDSYMEYVGLSENNKVKGAM